MELYLEVKKRKKGKERKRLDINLNREIIVNKMKEEVKERIYKS